MQVSENIAVKVKNVPLKKISEFENFQGNLKVLSSVALNKLKASILRNGFNAPVFVWAGHNYILDGHQRIAAVKSLLEDGHSLETRDSLPFVEIEADDERQAAEMVLSYNSQYGEMKLADLSDFVSKFDLDLPDLPKFTNLDVNLDRLIQVPKQVDEVSECPENPVSQTGEVWLLGKHKVMCGDSTKAEDVTKLMKGEKASVFLTYPPYGVDYGELVDSREYAQGHAGRRWDKITNDELKDEELQAFLESVFKNAKSHLKDDAAWYLWHAQKTQGFFTAAAAAAAAAGVIYHRQIIWAKPHFILGRGDYHWQHELCLYGWVEGSRPPFFGERNQSTIWEISRDAIHPTHPTQKPVELFLPEIKNHTIQGELVLDLFGGSGSVLIACEVTQRAARVMEIEPKYVDVILNRWVKFTGKQPVRESDGKAWGENEGRSPS